MVFIMLNEQMAQLRKNYGSKIVVKNVYEMYEQKDDGKLIRRHLRANFAKNHLKKQLWQWNIDNENELNELIDILKYFNKYFFNSTPQTNSDVFPEQMSLNDLILIENE